MVYVQQSKRPAQESTIKGMRGVKNVPYCSEMKWRERRRKLNLKTKTKNRNDHKGDKRQENKPENKESQCLAFNIIHSFFGQHPLLKRIRESLRCLCENTSIKAQDQTLMRMATSP